ncbi:MAG: hypothetical protein LBJ44_08490, partial [Propionibacteriaceae bacterium]|nr:hypothetical protein [Propionibacteriaceae bacterium]
MPVRANPQISINPGRQLKDWIAGWAALAGQPLATTAVDLLTDLKATMDRELRLCPLALGEARLLAQIQSGWAPDAKLGPSLAAVVREELDALGGQ